jgi:hypothetical protein
MKKIRGFAFDYVVSGVKAAVDVRISYDLKFDKTKR